MKKTTREWFNKKVNEIKKDLKTIGSKALVWVSLLSILSACSDSNITEAAKKFDDAKEEVSDAEENRNKALENLEKAKERLKKADIDYAEAEREVKQAAQNLK